MTDEVNYSVNLLILTVLGGLLATSEMLVKLAYQLLEIRSISAIFDLVLNLNLQEISILGLFLFIIAWVIAIGTRVLLSIPYSNLEAKLAIPYFRIIIIISSVILGYVFLDEQINIIEGLGIVFGILSLYYFSVGKSEITVSKES